MKKIFTLIIMASMTLKATAQLDNGFYRIQNTNTERYIVMYDPYVLVNKATVTVALDALQTITSWNTVRSHMGSVWYIESKGDSQYDLYCQHSSLGANSDGFYPSIFYNDGAYRIYGEYSGLTKYLSDLDDEDTGEGYVSIAGTKRNWNIIPIGGDNYIGIEPETKAEGHYWATFMSGFPFKLGSGMTAYYIYSVDDHGFAMTEMGSEIPARVPVLIRLNGSSPSDNIITLMKNSSAAAPSGNKLYGVWYSSNLGGRHEDHNVVCEDNNRILGEYDGKLAFVKGSGLIEHNRGYLTVGDDADSNIIESTSGITNIQAVEQTEEEEGIYTLTGQKIPEGTTLRSGIYIKNGKKVVIK